MQTEGENRRLGLALGSFGMLGLLSLATLEGTFRLVTLIVLGGLAMKTWIASVQRRRERAESEDRNNRKN